MCIDIADAVKIHLRDIDHPDDVYDVTYENAQARERTQVLMDMANKNRRYSDRNRRSFGDGAGMVYL